jgi:hypothetical protein
MLGTAATTFTEVSPANAVGLVTLLESRSHSALIHDVLELRGSLRPHRRHQTSITRPVALYICTLWPKADSAHINETNNAARMMSENELRLRINISADLFE